MKRAAAASLWKFARAVRHAQTRHRANSEEGATLVETALSMLILLAFIFGFIETSLVLYTYHFLSEAAREGTRYAIVRGQDCSGVTPCPALGTDVQTYVKNLGFPGIDPAKMTVPAPVWSHFTNGSSCPATGPCNSAGNLVTLTVQYSFPLSLPLVPFRAIAMSSTSAMIVQ